MQTSALIFVGVCAFALLFVGKQFVHDDMVMLLFNPHFSELLSWKDSFSFPLQATKPITSWLFALTNFAFDFSVFGQRLSSVVLHLLNIGLWFSLLQKRCSNSKLTFIASLAFAIAPLHSETLGIAQFRGEVVATTFCLLAWRLAPLALTSTTALIGTLVCLVGAGLTKEVFLPVTAALIFTEWNRIPVKGAVRFRANYLLGFIGVVAGTLLYALYLKDSFGPFSYRGQIGTSVFSFRQYVEFTSRALLEGMAKILVGHDLTTVRLSSRNGLGSSLPLLVHFLILSTFIIVAIRKIRRSEDQPMLLAFLLPVGFYLFIPNTNLGSEHYWYFPLAPGLFLGYLALAKRLSNKMVFTSVIAAHLFISFVVLQNRLLDYENRTTFYRSELDRYPESPWTWTNWALTEAENQKPWKEVLTIFEKASALGGGNDVEVQTLQAAIYQKRLDTVDKLLTACYQKHYKGRGMAVAYIRASFLFHEAGQRTRSLAAARTALSVYPGNDFAERLVTKLEDEIYRKPPVQELFAKSTLEEKAVDGI